MPATESSSSQAWKKLLAPRRRSPPERARRRRPRRPCASSAGDCRARRPRRRRWPSALPAPPASAREIAETAAWAADSRPAARREAGGGEPLAESAPAEATSGCGACRGRSPRSQHRPALPASATAIIGTTAITRRPRVQLHVVHTASAGSACRAKSQLFSIVSPGSLVAWRISTQRCSQAAGKR